MTGLDALRRLEIVSAGGVLGVLGALVPVLGAGLQEATGADRRKALVMFLAHLYHRVHADFLPFLTHIPPLHAKLVQIYYLRQLKATDKSD